MNLRTLANLDYDRDCRIPPHLMSHYGDLVPLWNDVRSITIAATEDELKQANGEELTLRP